jgi:hypothetical protein
VTQYVYNCSIIHIKLEGSHFKNPFFTKQVGKYPTPALKIVLKGIFEGVFHKALLIAGFRGVLFVTGSIIFSMSRFHPELWSFRRMSASFCGVETRTLNERLHFEGPSMQLYGQLLQRSPIHQ